MKRPSVELAQRGYDVVGLDINEPYIALARQLAVREGVQATFLTGDMREIPFESHFDAVINVGTSFGFFDSEVENHRVIKGVGRALKSRGLFLLEMANRDYYLGHFSARDWHKREDGSLILVQREFDYASSRINTFFERLGQGEPERWSNSWRAYTLAELVLMLEQAGLRFSRVLGDWESRTYNVDSPRMVLVSEKE